MLRKKRGIEGQPTPRLSNLAERLANELKSNRECSQPMIEEQDFPNGRLHVTVIGDDWDRLPLEERTVVILRAYELAEGRDYRSRIFLASGLTVPEAHAAGMLPYQIIPALRNGDPVTPEQCRQAMLDEGASSLVNPSVLQLRFATQGEAEACVRRLIQRLPGSDPVWLINRAVTAPDFATVQETAEIGEG